MGDLNRIVAALNARQSGDGWTARCPAHKDHHPSLSVRKGREGRVLLYCHAGCSLSAILAALHCEPQAVMQTMNQPLFSPGLARNVECAYPYYDADGKLLYSICRLQGKSGFIAQSQTSTGQWINGLNGSSPTLYWLPEVLAAASDGKRIWVVEGEKDVETLRSYSLPATTNPFGAGKWRPEYSSLLKGASEVYVVPDNDEPGIAHAEQVQKSLLALDIPTTIVPLPGAGPKDDITDWLLRGGSLDQLAQGYAGPCRRLDSLLADPVIMTPPSVVAPRFAWRGRSTLVAAGEKSGKSTLMTYLSARVSRGEPCFGEPCAQGTVLILALEDALGDVARRLRHFGADPGFVFLSDKTGSWLEAEIRRIKAALVIVDTLIEYCAGRVDDAFSSVQMGPVVTELTRIAHDTGAAVIIVHHARKSDGKYRDSSAIGAAVDVIIEIFQPNDTDAFARRALARGRVQVPLVTDFRLVNGNDYALAEGIGLAERILDYVRTNPGCSLRGLGNMGARWTEVQQTVARMIRDGTLRNEGDERGAKLYL